MIHREQTTTGDPVGAVPIRWECGCRETPVLLGTYEADGRINLKSRDRYWHVYGRVETHCPRCGAERVLDLAAGQGHGQAAPDRRPVRPA